MPASAFDLIMTQTGVPALLRVMGIPARHTPAGGDETAVTIILKTQAVAVGEFGERMEPQTTIQIPAASGARVGDTFTVTGTVTLADPYPDDLPWIAAQLLRDDGYFRTFAARAPDAAPANLLWDDGMTYLLSDDGSTRLTWD